MSDILKKAKENRSKKENKVEITKKLKAPLEVYNRLDEIAAGGYDELAKEDSAYFLKCFGLFDKGTDFMLRVRIPSGRLTATQARRIGEVAKKYCNGYIDLSTRMQVVLRFIEIGNIAKVIKEIEEVGLSTFQTGVDNNRNIVSDPLDGLAFDNVIETSPIVDEIESRIIKNPEWISTMPRKFNTGILGSLSNSCNIYGHDCSFVLAQKDGVFGFNLYLGARVGVVAKDANLFVQAKDVPHLYEAILRVFREYGYRDNRNKNRLHFLLLDVGVEAFVDAVKKEADREYQDAGVVMVQSKHLNYSSAKILLKDGTFAYKMIVPSGVFNGDDMIELSSLAQKYGSGELRLSYDQNIYIVGIKDESFEEFDKEELISAYSRYQNIYYKDTIACAGTHTCSYGVIPNKPDALDLSAFLASEVALDEGQIRLNWSACPKGCGIHGVGDIGFEGCKAKDDEGNRVDGVHLFIGGKITREPKEAYTLHKTLPITEAKHHVKYLIKAYAKFKNKNESFEEFESRFLSTLYSYQAIAFYTKVNFVLEQKLGMSEFFELESEPKSYKNEQFEIFHFGLRLFRLLTNEKRYEAVEGIEPVLKSPRKIKRDEVSRINPKVHPKLSEAIYLMTHEDRSSRAQVFSELMTLLKEI